MVREYIGARYVPKFMGVYDPTTQYEALCVVDNGQGTSYITKIPTPAGTPLTDTNYWFLYGATNGAIIHLQDEIDDLTSHCVYNSRGIIFISDSFTNYYVGGKNMMELAAEYLGVTNYIAVGANGAGFVAGTETFNDILNGITPPTWEVSDVVVLGGTNDHNISTADITTAMQTFVLNAKTLYPNAKIWFGCTGGPSYKNANVNGPLQTINNIYPAYLNCIKIGAYPLNNLISALHGNINKRSDETHPTDDGVILLAKSIAECLNGGTCHNQYLIANDASNTTLENGGTFLASNIVQNVNNDTVTIFGTGLTNISYASPITITGSTNVLLMTFDKFIAAPNLAIHVPTQVLFVVSGTAHLQYCDLFVDSNRLFLRTALGTVSNVERIQFTLPEISIPINRC